MRPRLLLAVLLVCVSASLLAQTPGESTDAAPTTQAAPHTRPPAPAAATAVITGTVYCNDTHRPARGAIVIAQPVPKGEHLDVSFSSGMGRVGMDGTYTIQQLRPGDYSIIALLPGYVSPFDGVPVDQTASNDAEIRARLLRNGVVSVHNNETARMDLTIQRGASISGRVLYDDGSPATQVTISLEDVNAKPPAPKPARSGSDFDMLPGLDSGALIRSLFLHQPQGTDDQGNFRLSGIKPGTYRIAALPSTASPSAGTEAAMFIFGGLGSPRAIRIYSGDTLHKTNAKTYDLRPGDEVNGVQITIPIYAFHHVEGHLTTLDGHPILLADVTLTDASDDTFVLHVHSARDGSFVFPEVPSGSYKLAVSGAKSGTADVNFPDNVPLAAEFLHNVQSFADNTSTVLVKDADITDLTIQLQNAPPAPDQPSTTTEPASNSSPDDKH